MICESAYAKKLKDYSEYLKVNKSFCQFTYAYDNKEVSIKAPTEDVINQVLVVEDA